MNSVILTGRLTTKPYEGVTINGKAFSKFSLAVKKDYVPNLNNKMREVDYISCSAFNSIASFVNRFLDKGDYVLVKGQLTYINQKNDNNQASSHYFIDVKSIEPLETKETIEKRRALNVTISSKNNLDNAFVSPNKSPNQQSLSSYDDDYDGLTWDDHY
ncbi:Single-strand binding protein (Helix-destabilizing protein) [Metamycoplasma auris 15026]|uniref:Single-stranded DNA-binding protein n=1 Tax=Metamycoplasma auris 15026 TaxID=1188233 RepID=N9V168_9BACT|nr:single-stranded DNA-binding protein [Metamycoplasma auris]ENY69137.1 Single-strand binding protein (Helix-destabilizing protein) [Metamycoplasma auris 15026]